MFLRADNGANIESRRKSTKLDSMYYILYATYSISLSFFLPGSRERRKAAVAEPQEDVAFPRWLPRLPLPLERFANFPPPPKMDQHLKPLPLFSDYSAYVAGLPQESVSIITKKGQETPRRVPLFAGTPIAEDEEDLRPGDATLLLNAGGPVWGMDWCPLPHRPETWNALGTPTRHYLAVGCHPSPSSTHVQGKAVQGPALIQIWDLGPLSDDKEPYSYEPSLSQHERHNLKSPPPLCFSSPLYVGMRNHQLWCWEFCMREGVYGI
mgnify:CR=1 FL=1